METDTIPAPQLFVDTIQHQWSTPTSGPAPSTNDRRFYNVADDLNKALLWPTIDPPVAALYTNTTILGVQEGFLKPEDRWADQVIQQGHQAAAWVVRASTAASFFSRSSLSWLQQL